MLFQNTARAEVGHSSLLGQIENKLIKMLHLRLNNYLRLILLARMANHVALLAGADQ